MLAQVARFYAQVPDNEHEPTTAPPIVHPDTMIASVIAAEYYRRQGDTHQTITSLNRAATTASIPSIQKPLLFPARVDLSPDGSIILKGNAPSWEVRRDTKVSTEFVRNMVGTGTFRFEQSPVEQNRAVLSWKYPFDIPYHHQLRFDVRVEQGCLLQIETVIDNQSVRHQLQPEEGTIHAGTNKWEQLTIQAEGTSLRYIYLILDLDPSTEVQPKAECSMEIKSVTFLLDDAH